MAEFKISDNDLSSLRDKVAIVTGGSSGIGLATVKLLMEHGATVVSADMNPSPLEDGPKHTFQKTDVTSWPSLLALFKLTKEKHGRIDHVHANAGISGRADYLNETFDGDGNLQEPDRLCFDINLRGCINTAYLGIHHMRHQSPPGGSVVMTASASSFQRFRVADYTTAKHGVLGYMRGMVPLLRAGSLPIRINCIGPSWTITGIVPQALVDALGDQSQGPEVAARSAAILMADEARDGQFIYSWEGKFMEVEEARFLPVVREMMGSAGDTGEAPNGHDIEDMTKIFSKHGAMPAGVTENLEGGKS